MCRVLMAMRGEPTTRPTIFPTEAEAMAGSAYLPTRIYGGGNDRGGDDRQMVQTWIQQTALVVMGYILAIDREARGVTLPQEQRAVAAVTRQAGRDVLEAWFAGSVPFVR